MLNNYYAVLPKCILHNYVCNHCNTACTIVSHALRHIDLLIVSISMLVNICIIRSVGGSRGSDLFMSLRTISLVLLSIL